MRALIFLLVILLSGCQTADLPEPQASPRPEFVTESVTEPVREQVVEVVVEEPLKPHFILENIMNLAPDTLQNILGKPSLKRVERDARVWLYRNDECVLHLYFYPDDNGDFRLDYVETAAADMTADNPTVSPGACLDSHVASEDIIGDPQPSSADKDTGPQPDRSDN